MNTTMSTTTDALKAEVSLTSSLFSFSQILCTEHTAE